MAPHVPQIGRTDAFLNAVASRTGLTMAIVVLVSICVGAAYYVQLGVQQVEHNHAVFKDAQLRNGYVALSDIQRLTLILKDAAVGGEMTPAMKSDFRDATDVLYVRTDNFEVQMAKGDGLETGRRSIAALWKIVEIADDAIANDFSDIQDIAQRTLAAAAEARTHVVQFLDDTRRKADNVLEIQSQAVQRQQVFVLAALLGLGIFGTVALLFLRREVVGRQARRAAEERVAYLAFYDQLTKLPNRTQFQDRLQGMLDDRVDLALFFIDLDDFKRINDTYGHAAGDAVLRHTATKIGDIAADHKGFAARLGGDEFAMVLPDGGLWHMRAVCEALVDQASGTVTMDRETVQTTLSVGLSITSQMGQLGEPTVDLLSRLTDFALYEAKAAGRNCYQVYDEKLEARFQERRQLMEDLPAAIAGNALEVHFQPKVMLADRHVYGFEALVRWRRNGTLVPPDKFIVLAEESGCVLDIDNYVLNQSARVVAAFNDSHDTDFSVSVNLSALHFNSTRIVTEVREVLRRSGLPPNLLTLEITETMEVRDWKKAQETVSMLHDLGCRIAIDDFGVGYSSLAYLRSAVADELKIDRSLILEIEESQSARMLLTSVVEIARNLDLDVTIEGIETEAQASVLADIGVLQAQGYLYGRPGPAAQVLPASNNLNTRASSGLSA